jgi:CheY-like chemotaxis protein
MPVMYAVAFIPAIRQDQRRIPIIMLFGSHEVRREAYAAGVTVFLEKPVNVRHLMHTMAEFLPHSTV